MTFDEAIAFLDERIRYGTRPGLERIAALTEALDHPQRSYRVVHVSGTNGKFSVAAMTTAILGELGLTVGTYTSPHVESVTERIAVGGAAIEPEDFAEALEYMAPYIELVEQRIDDRLTYFETVTGLALEWFFDRAVHAAVVETGLGGEWDATNVADGDVAVVTKVARDHEREFGGDLERAAWEKSGIIKEGAVVVTGVEQPELLDIVEARARERAASEVVVLHRDVHVSRRAAVGGQLVDVRTRQDHYADVFVPLHGAHQGANAALAIAACEAFAGGGLDRAAVERGLGGVEAPARIEVVSRHPLVVLDGGHNADAAAAVVDTVREEFAFERQIVVVGMLDEKLVEDVLAVLAPTAERFVATAPDTPRAASADRIAHGLSAGVSQERIDTAPTVPEALRLAMSLASDDDLVLVFGSFYVVGEARAWLRERSASPQA